MKKNGEDDEVSLYWKYKAKEYSEKAQQPDRNEERLDRVSDEYDKMFIYILIKCLFFL